LKRLITSLICAAGLCAGAALAQSPVALTIDTRSPGYAVPTNFAGLSMSAHNFLDLETNADAQVFTLFQNIGLHSLRLGFGAPVSNPDIDTLFAFQRAMTNLQVIFELPFSDIPDTVSAAQYIWTNYQSQFYAFELANEPDKSADWTNYASFFTQWTNYAMAVTSAVPGAVFEGPDPAGQTWGAEFANDLKGSALLVLISQHWYVGGNPNKYDPNSTAQLQIDNMLSNAWVNSLYPSTYNNALVPAQAAGFPFRFTEADDCDGGVTNASNAFAAALWALDFLHWWAAQGCAGVNFQNTAWIPTDTIYPAANGNCQINPKAYGIKAFNVGDAGCEESVLMSNTNGLNLTAYAIGLGTNLYVTVINKEHDTGARDASVTISPNGFLTGSVAAMYLTAPNGDVGATNGVTFGGAVITNNGPWLGQWTPLNPLVNGQCTVTVAAASAVVIRIQASALITPVVLESWTAGSDDYTNDADWMPPLAFSTNGPNNNDDTGNSYTIVITNGGTCYYDGASGDPVWTNTIGQLWLGGIADGVGGGMSNIFSMSGGSLTLADSGPSDFSIGGNTPGIGVIPSTNLFIMTGGTLNAMASTETNWIAAAPGSVATVDFNGGAANLVTLGIGGRGNATVNINGGNVTIGGGSAYLCGIGLGVGAGEGAGTLNLISGALTATNRSGRAVILGNNCANNILNISGGTLNASGIQFGFGTSSSSVTNTLIVSGGAINISGAGIGRNGAKDINNTFLSGGTFSTLTTPLNTNASWDWSGLVPIVLSNLPGPGIVILAPVSGMSIEFDSVMSGNGGLEVAGPGLVLLTAVETYTGDTLMTGGVLALTNGSSLASDAISVAAGGTLDVSALSALSLGQGQTLSGNGTVIGPITGNIGFNGGSTLAAGLSASNCYTLTISNNLVFNAGSTNYVVVNKTTGSIANDEVTGLTSVTLGGALVITNIGAMPLVPGDAIPLFSSVSYHTNGFGPGNIIPATPGNGLKWDTSTLGSDGTLRVASTFSVNTNPTNILFSVSNNQLTLNWPADHIGWQLQAQTNSPASGLGTNWFHVSGSSNVNQIVLPINLTNGSVFYRLIDP
jgi:hypothetical protein